MRGNERNGPRRVPGQASRLGASAPNAVVAPGKRTRTQSMVPSVRAASGPLQRKSALNAEPERLEQAALTARWMQTAMRPDLHPLPAQRKVKGGASGDGRVAKPAGSGGEPMPEGVRAKMEHAFATDFSAVRIHQGPQAQTLGAQAYTQGTDIHFAPGQYEPGSQRGQELLGHELTHVVQQAQGRVRSPPGMQAASSPINDDAALESCEGKTRCQRTKRRPQRWARKRSGRWATRS